MLLFSAALFPMWYLTSLYLQEVLHMPPLGAGLAFLPMALTIMACATRAGSLVARFGVRPVLGSGLTLMAAGMALFVVLISVNGSYGADVLLPGLLVSIGIGLAVVPSTIAATAGAEPSEAGLASGLVNTSRQMGGALGLAILASLGAQYTSHLLNADYQAPLVALTNGFRLAYLLGGVFVAAAALVTFRFIPKAARPAAAGQLRPDPGPGPCAGAASDRGKRPPRRRSRKPSCPSAGSRRQPRQTPLAQAAPRRRSRRQPARRPLAHATNARRGRRLARGQARSASRRESTSVVFSLSRRAAGRSRRGLDDDPAVASDERPSGQASGDESACAPSAACSVRLATALHGCAPAAGPRPPTSAVLDRRSAVTRRGSQPRDRLAAARHRRTPPRPPRSASSAGPARGVSDVRVVGSRSGAARRVLCGPTRPGPGRASCRPARSWRASA